MSDYRLTFITENGDLGADKNGKIEAKLRSISAQYPLAVLRVSQ